MHYDQINGDGIAHFLDWFGYARGGAELIVEGLCHVFPGRFTIISARNPFIKPSYFIENIQVKTRIGFYQLRELAFLLPPGRIRDLLYLIPGWCYAPRAARLATHFRMVHIHSMDVLRFVKATGPQRVLTLYNHVVARDIPLLSRADKIIVQSSDVLRNIFEHAPSVRSRLVHITPAYPDWLYPLHMRQEDRFVGDPARLLVIGRFRSVKNIQGALDILFELRSRKKRDWRMTIVGAGPRHCQLRQLARRLAVAPYVDFRTNLPATAIARLYQDHDCVLVPSLYETFSMVALEALASGTRLVISEGLREFCRYFTDIPTAPTNKPKQWAELVEKAVESPRQYVSESALRNLSWSEVRKHYEAIYDFPGTTSAELVT